MTPLYRTPWALVLPVIAVTFAASWLLYEEARPRWDSVPTTLNGLLPLVLITTALALSRLAPWVALALGTAALLDQVLLPDHRFSDTSWPMAVALLAVAAVLGTAPQRSLRMSALLVAVLGGAITTAFTTILSPKDMPDYGLNILVVAALAAGAWCLGFGFRAGELSRQGEQRRHTMEQELATAEIELLVVGERDRLAQDVHDIMAHSLSVILAQAEGARSLLERRPETTASSLAAIADSARASLVEVRTLITSLGSDTAPAGHAHPAIDDLATLLDRLRTAGLRVEFAEFGERAALTSGQELAVYRILQESLTNALKHGGRGACAQVVLDWRGPGLAISVVSRSETSLAPNPGTGRGLRGMTERARLAGGWLSAGADEAEPGRYVVTASLPLLPLTLGELTAQVSS